VVATAVKHGYISERVPVPKLSNRGLKGTSRPAFDAGEIEQRWQINRYYGGG